MDAGADSICAQLAEQPAARRNSFSILSVY